MRGRGSQNVPEQGHRRAREHNLVRAGKGAAGGRVGRRHGLGESGRGAVAGVAASAASRVRGVRSVRIISHNNTVLDGENGNKSCQQGHQR